MALPTDFPNWSTTANYITGPDVGTPTKVAPSSGEIAEGFVPDTAAVPQYMNYLLANASAWFTYLKNLKDEAFTWTAAHTFTGSAGFQNNTAFSGQVTLSGANPILTNEVVYATPKVRRNAVPMTAFDDGNTAAGGTWKFDDGSTGTSVLSWTCPAGAADYQLIGQTNVPNGCTVTGATLVINAITAGVTFFELEKHSFDPSTGSVTRTVIGTSGYAATGLHPLSITGLSVATVAGDSIVIRLHSGINLNTVSLSGGASVDYTETRATGS